MNSLCTKLTIYFEEPFYIGIFELLQGRNLSVCKVTFGAEPKDNEVYEFILNNCYKLNFSRSVGTDIRKKADNPKRRQRSVRKQLENHGIGTKSQQALKIQREELKTERKQIKHQKKEEEKQQQFQLKQIKRKEKHKGH